MFKRRDILTAGLAAPLFFRPGRPRAQMAGPPGLDELLQPSVLKGAALSPDGQKLAILRQRFEGPKRTTVIHILPASDPKATPVEVKLGDNDVEAIDWANEDRLLVWLYFDKTADGKPTGIMAYGKIWNIPVRRLMAIGADGKNPVVFFAEAGLSAAKLFNLSTVVDFLPKEPNHILMQRWDVGQGRPALFRIDVRDGRPEAIEWGERSTDGWFTQDGVPVLRVDSNSRGTSVSLFGRAPGGDKWTLIRKLRRDELNRMIDFQVVGMADQPGVVLVSHRGEADENVVIRQYDLKSFSLGSVVAQVPGRDLETLFQDELGRVVAAGYVDDRQNYLFLQPGLAGHYKGLSAYFGNDCNLELVDIDRELNRMLIYVSGPKVPGAIVLYDVKAKHLEELGDRQPWLAAERLATVETLKVKTRDGAEIGAYLTKPLASGPRPMVVMPHGGPELRDQRSWDIEAQALAAKGWLVLQPNFRGSGGFGRSFADAGRKRWGNRMQEDVEDAVAQVVASGLADPKKIAIYGGSYGGYAALMGAVRTPQLYRCAICFAGPADLLKMLAFVRKEDGDDSPGYQYWLKTMGDPAADAAMLKAASPALNVEKVSIPVLIMHGAEDPIVPVEQGRLMAKALKDAGKPHEYFEMAGVGHGGFTRDDQRKYLDKVIGYLGQHLT